MLMNQSITLSPADPYDALFNAAATINTPPAQPHAAQHVSAKSPESDLMAVFGQMQVSKPAAASQRMHGARRVLVHVYVCVRRVCVCVRVCVFVCVCLCVYVRVRLRAYAFDSWCAACLGEITRWKCSRAYEMIHGVFGHARTYLCFCLCCVNMYFFMCD